MYFSHPLLTPRSNQLSNSLPFGHHDSMSQDITSSISSELEQPGTASTMNTQVCVHVCPVCVCVCLRTVCVHVCPVCVCVFTSGISCQGTFRNLTSAGRVSPHRTRTMKDQEMVSASHPLLPLPSSSLPPSHSHRFFSHSSPLSLPLSPPPPPQQLSDLKKENFGLKLRIYHLEEALRKQWGDDSEGWRLVRAHVPL